MGAVVKFTVACERERERRAETPAVVGAAAAEIIIFPGVRYERSEVLPAIAPDSETYPVARDRLELTD